MIEQNPTAPSTTRATRGLALYRSRGHEIERLGDQRLSVPSCTGTHRYLVDLKAETCSCEDSIRRGGGCKHVVAALIAHATTATCSGCGIRCPRRGLIELNEDNHDNLSYFDGDLLCEECAEGAGVL